jgi:hypothetical protein
LLHRVRNIRLVQLSYQDANGCRRQYQDEQAPGPAVRAKFGPVRAVWGTKANHELGFQRQWTITAKCV